MYTQLLGGSRTAVFLRAMGMTVLIALADWHIKGNIPLGFLYLFPMVLCGSALTRWQTALMATLCAVLTEAFDSYEWVWETGIPRDILILSAFFGMGLFVYEVVRSRKIELIHMDQVEREVEARREAEAQLKILIESSPAAIFTSGPDGTVILANEAAHRLFALPAGSLPGRSVREFLPALVNVPAMREGSQVFRTAMQCRGVRADGEVFQADIWFSTYQTNSGPRLAAMVIDSSEDLRNREEVSLQQMMTGSRILVGAVSHEIRNVCGAIAVVHQNLSREGRLQGNKDFETLGTLIVALERVAAIDLRDSAGQASLIDLESLLQELRIIIEPALQDDDIAVEWAIPAELPPVWADAHSLLQVFLNLVKNSQRAMQDSGERVLSFTVAVIAGKVTVRVSDTGHGVKEPGRLFRPFESGAKSTGLGLYLSRAFLRGFRGDLRFEPSAKGANFIVELLA